LAKRKEPLANRKRADNEFIGGWRGFCIVKKKTKNRRRRRRRRRKREKTHRAGAALVKIPAIEPIGRQVSHTGADFKRGNLQLRFRLVAPLPANCSRT
jgi:hypothetical protein